MPPADRERDGRTEQRTSPRFRLDQPRPPRRKLLPEYDPEAFGRLSERIARFLGTGRFIVWMTITIIVWVAWNVWAPEALRFDPFPFLFLTLALSLQASYAAPLILLAQNRQDDRDRSVRADLHGLHHPEFGDGPVDLGVVHRRQCFTHRVFRSHTTDSTAR